LVVVVVVLVVVVVVVAVVMVGGGWDAMLLLTAGILAGVVRAAPLGGADIGAAVATMAGHCCSAPEGGRLVMPRWSCS
jgi:hypothetical protein